MVIWTIYNGGITTNGVRGKVRLKGTKTSTGIKENESD